jgi:hypothetical protein
LALFSKDFKAERIGIELSYSRAQAAECWTGCCPHRFIRQPGVSSLLG